MSVSYRSAAFGLALAAGAALSGCQGATTMPAQSPAPVAGFVTDLAAFDRFIATQPTPEGFKAQYPDVTLVLPGQMATKELRGNNSRYFARLDDAGRIVGGKFQ